METPDSTQGDVSVFTCRRNKRAKITSISSEDFTNIKEFENVH